MPRPTIGAPKGRRPIFRRRLTVVSGMPVLTALLAASKVLSCWVLPEDDMTTYLAMTGPNVNTWRAAGGTNPQDLTNTSNFPTLDAAAFVNNGGVAFNGTTQFLRVTAAGFLGVSQNHAMLASLIYTGIGGASGNVIAFGNGSGSRGLSSRNTAGTDNDALGSVAGISDNTGDDGIVVAPAGSVHTGGYRAIWGSAITAYLMGTPSVTPSALGASGTVTGSVLSMGVGRNAIGSNTGFYAGKIGNAAILNENAVLQDFLDLEAEFRSRTT